MSGNLKIYLAILIFGLVVTGIRILIASGDSKGKQEEANQKKEQNNIRMNDYVQQHGGHVDFAFSTGCASMAVDKTQGMIYVISGKQEKYSLKDIADVKLVDKSEDYKYVQKMEQLHSGVDRGPMMDPYRGHSMREVKDAHQRFQDWTGAIVYGVELKFNDNRTPVETAFYRADSTVFWTEDQNLSDCKQFVKALDQAMWDAK